MAVLDLGKYRRCVAQIHQANQFVAENLLYLLTHRKNRGVKSLDALLRNLRMPANPRFNEVEELAQLRVHQRKDQQRVLQRPVASQVTLDEIQIAEKPE